jgi:acyl-CoA reductase-like NAD-dependent aldehyde dehydrogenase
MNAIPTAVVADGIPVRNPATDQAFGEIPCVTAQEIEAAVKRAHAAQSRWAALPVAARLKLLKRFQQILCDQKESVAQVITREAGKPIAEALATEVLVVLEAVNFLLENVPAFLQPEAVPHSSPVMKLKRGWLVREPYGVIGIISPWNYPFSIPSV